MLTATDPVIAGLAKDSDMGSKPILESTIRASVIRTADGSEVIVPNCTAASSIFGKSYRFS